MRPSLTSNGQRPVFLSGLVNGEDVSKVVPMVRSRSPNLEAL